ncbi:hypothetical protein HK105_203391 [Polyrhizophydium stewartii]|uniref:CCZ1/INTU/HSP4 first Longin domain-containing protein n=1 Tax=Polyrhizophydium stewartii TaxID=2732419 RepID=A0ABR4NBP3_9FUNG
MSSASQPIVVPPALAAFVVFNSDAPLAEDAAAAAQQICFFHPPNLPLNDKLKLVGLLQGLVAFSRSFPVARPCEVVRTRKSRCVLREVEPGFWLFVLTYARLGTVHSQKVRLGARVLVDKSRKKLADFADAELHDNVLWSLVDRAYARFRMFFGSFRRLQATYANSPAAFTETVDSFFSTFVGPVTPLVSSADLLTSLNGIHRLPLDKPLNSRIATLVREIQSSFNFVSASCLFFKHHLLWSDLPSLADTHTFYDYITDPETGKLDDSIVNQVKDKGEPIMSSRPTSFSTNAAPLVERTSTSIFAPRAKPEPKFTGFLVGPEISHMGSSSSTSTATAAAAAAAASAASGPHLHQQPRIKHVYLGPDAVPHGLVVYQLLDDTTLALFVNLLNLDLAARLTDPRTYEKLYAHLADVLTPLNERLTEAYKLHVKQLYGFPWSLDLTEFPSVLTLFWNETPDQAYRFLSIDRINFAIKASIGVTKSMQVSDDIIAALGQINEDLSNNMLGVKETVIRGLRDTWIIGTHARGARVFLVIQRPEATLADISDEVERFKASNISLLKL